MSEMLSDTAAVAVDTQSSDDTAELSETPVGEVDSDQALQIDTSEVADSDFTTATEVITEPTVPADTDAAAAAASSHETATDQLLTSGTNSADPVHVLATDEMQASESDNIDAIAAGVPTTASEPSSASASVSSTADFWAC